MNIERKRTARVFDERGSIDSLIFIVPAIFLMIVVISMFQYGVSLGRLNSSAIYIGRELARDEEISHSLEQTQTLIDRHNLEIKDFHVMHFPIGARVFVQLVLVGKPIRVGWFSMTPSARSLTVQDEW